MVLLGTALVGVRAENGQRYMIRTLIDGVSQSSFVTMSCVQRLGLKFRTYIIPWFGIGTTKGHASKSICELVSVLKDPRDSAMVTSAIIVPKVTGNQPAVNLRPDIRLHFCFSPLADEKFDEKSRIDILLSAVCIIAS